jgi:hypothetical protein
MGAGFATQLIYHDKVDAIFGPVCLSAAEIVASLAAYKNTPHFLWTTTSADFFVGRKKYPTTISSAGTVTGTLMVLGKMLERFRWTEMAFLYTSAAFMTAEHVPVCNYFAEALAVGIRIF